MTTYTDRRQDLLVVAAIETLNNRITADNGLSYFVPEGLLDKFSVGTQVIHEAKNGKTVGWFVNEEWIWRESDEKVKADREALIERIRQDRLALVEANRERWTENEASLPQWIRDRLDYFRSIDAETFEMDGWGYELCIARLAVAYANMGDAILGKSLSDIVDSDEVRAIANEEGSSGNQHGMALLLARAHLESPEASLAGTVSALSVLTGKAAYTKD